MANVHIQHHPRNQMKAKKKNARIKIKRAIHSINRTQCSSEPFQIFIHFIFIFRYSHMPGLLVYSWLSRIYYRIHLTILCICMPCIHGARNYFIQVFFDSNRFYDAHIIANWKRKTHTSCVRSFVCWFCWIALVFCIRYTMAT